MKLCLTCGEKIGGPGWECPVCHSGPEFKGGVPVFSPELEEDGGGFDATYFTRLFDLEARNFWFRSRNRLIVWALRSHFPGARNFFEIGCGTGFVLSGIEKEAPHLSLFGSDVHLEGLGFASKRLKRAELLQMDARRIPFEDEFDVIGAFDVLEHVEQDELVLSEMYKAACGGGGIMVTVPQHEFLWSPTDEHARHVRRYHRRELREKVERAGLEVLMITSFVSLPFPMMVLNRIMMKRKTEHDPMMELKIGGIANKVLEKTLDLERALIRLGINLPAGGSLLLIARKR